MRSKQLFIMIYSAVNIMLLTLCANAIVEHDDLFNPPEIKDGTKLSVIDCVSLAFRNNPKIKRKKYELDIAKSNVKIAQSAYFPIIEAGVGFQYERNSNDVYYDKKYRNLPNVGVAINKMIWDFGKTSSLIKMEKFYKITAEYEFMDELCHILFDIKAKYYNLLKDKALRDTAKENLELNKRFYDIAQEDIDKSTVKVYINSADAKYINAQGDVDISKLDLSNSMYANNSINYEIINTPTFLYLPYDRTFKPVDFPFNQNEAVDIAYKNSPDLMVLLNTKNAMEESLKYTKKSYLPELSGGVGYGYDNTNFARNNNLQASVNLSSDVNLMELKYNIDNAKSKLDIADNEIDLFKKDLSYEVQRALGNVETYQELISKYEKEVKNSTQNLELAFDEYKNNKINYIALHESIEDNISAKEKYITCLYNYNMSLIQTEMAMHYHMVDIHNKAEHAMHHHANELIEHLNDALNCDKKEKTKKGNK